MNLQHYDQNHKHQNLINHKLHEKEKTKTSALTKLNRELSVELQRSKSSPSYAEDFLK